MFLSYSYYNGQNLKGITTSKGEGEFFVLKNQKALQDLRASLSYVPKTEAEVKALNAQGIKYEIAEEVTDFGYYGKRINSKEIYIYPENYPIKTKEVYYGNRFCTSNDGKEITLTFREPQQTSNPHYKADAYTFKIRENGFESDSRTFNFVPFEREYGTSVIPFNYKTNAYEEIMNVLKEEYSDSALTKIRYGH